VSEIAAAILKRCQAVRAAEVNAARGSRTSRCALGLTRPLTFINTVPRSGAMLKAKREVALRNPGNGRDERAPERTASAAFGGVHAGRY